MGQIIITEQKGLKKMKLVMSLMTLAALAAYAQDHLHVWSAQDPNSTQYLVNGQTVKSIDAGGLRVAAAILDTGSKMRVDVGIINNSGQPVDVRPEQFKLVAANGKELKYNDPAAMARSIRRRAIIAGMMVGAGGAMQTRTTTSTTVDSGTATATATGPGGTATGMGTYNGVSMTTTTSPDYEAQRRSAQQANQIGANARNAIGSLQSIALRANTVFPAHQIQGAVYFDRERKYAKVLTITLGSETFQFSLN
jgi:hypothetical protein